MTGWFGPTGDCGCECDVPIVPCDCDPNPLINDGPCTPVDPGYFNNLTVEVSGLPNEIWKRLDQTLNVCDGRECAGGLPLSNLLMHKIVGMNQFNGSYPAIYYEYDAVADEYYESDPRNGCGFWGYTNVTKTLRLEITRQQEFTISDCSVLDLFGYVDFNVTFDVVNRNGIVPPTYPIPKPASWDFRLWPGDLVQPLLPSYPSSPFIPTVSSRFYAECAIFSDATGTTGTLSSNDPIVLLTGLPGAAVQTIPSIEHNLWVTVPGSVTGLFPSTNFPPGVTMLDGTSCGLLSVESVFEYEPHSTRTTRMLGECEAEYTDHSSSGWFIRRKLLYDGRRDVP